MAASGGAAVRAGRDPGLQGIDWTPLHATLAARGLLERPDGVGATNWRDAGKIAYALGARSARDLPQHRRAPIRFRRDAPG